VCQLTYQGFVSVSAMPWQCAQVALRAERDEWHCLLAANRRLLLLQNIAGWVVAANIIAEFGARGSFEHLGYRPCDSVAAQVNHIHGLASIKFRRSA
jgi:hypothetical protein